MADLLELVVSATASGSIYALVALSYLLIIRPTGIINFAVGEWAMVGSFGAVAVMTALIVPDFVLPYILGFVVVVGVMAAAGWLIEWTTVRPLVNRGAPVLSPILALLGVFVIFREIGTIMGGTEALPTPPPFGFRRAEIGPFAGTPQAFFIITMAAVIFLGVWLFFERTLWGKRFEAVAINRRAAALMGINLKQVTALAFAAGAAVTAVVGILVSGESGAFYLMGLPLAVSGFTALVIGGIGRVEGAYLGGMILAFAEAFAARYANIQSDYVQAVPLILLIVVLLVRPTGLIRPKEARS